jgi:hypothetical protein
MISAIAAMAGPPVLFTAARIAAVGVAAFGYHFVYALARRRPGQRVAISNDSFMKQEALMSTNYSLTKTLSPRAATARAIATRAIAAFPLVVLLGTTPGRADPTIYFRVGSWHAFTDKDAQGAAVCGIGTENPTDGRKLSMTYTVGGNDLTVQAVKPSWTIPDGSTVEADMQIDRDQSWQAQATGHGTDVEWVISAANIREFDTQFRNGGTLTVSFPSGNEAPWTLALSGSTMASATLWRCVQYLSDRAHVTTPASNAPSPTQPISQAPTQPYTPPAAQAAAPAAAPPANGAPAQTAIPPVSATAAQPAAPPTDTTAAPTSTPATKP